MEIAQAQCSPGLASSYEPPSITSRLKAQKESLERQLDKVNEALSCLEGNPALQKAVDAISRVGNY
jgi:hypothetical protein